MMRDLQRRVRKLESILPPMLNGEVSWMFGVLWFAVAYYLGNPSPDDKPIAAYARALGYANEFDLNSAMEKNDRDLSNRVYRAEDKVYAKFGIHTESLEDSDSKKLAIAIVRMEIGLPQSYKNELKMVLTRTNDLGWMRVHSDDVRPYLRCFGVNPAYLREMIQDLVDRKPSVTDEKGGVRLRTRPQKKLSWRRANRWPELTHSSNYRTWR